MSLLELHQVTVDYNGVRAINRVSLVVPEGSITALIGANAAGKSTVLKVIVGLKNPASGDVLFGGRSIAHLSPEKIVPLGISLCPEGRRLFPELSVRENLLLGAYSRRETKEVRKDLERVLAYFPHLRGRVHQAAGSLSGGEQQMVAIGRALMARPRLLLLDEPSLGLAPLVVKTMGELIRQINSSGVTIVLVEQNARMALRLASRAYLLETGRVVMEGSGQELLVDDYVRKAYLGG